MDGDTEAHAVRGKALWPPARAAAAAPRMRPVLLQGAAAGAGKPQPAGKHEETRGVLQDIIHLAVGSAVKKVTVLVEICALIYFCLFV